jgi:hypothetical protein
MEKLSRRTGVNSGLSLLYEKAVSTTEEAFPVSS